MAFGINRVELQRWKDQVIRGEIAIITHYWYDKRFPQYSTVTKIGCNNLEKLKQWGKKYALNPKWIDQHKKYPHYDLFGSLQLKVLMAEKQFDQIKKFQLDRSYLSRK